MLYTLLQLHMPCCSIYLVANIAATHKTWFDMMDQILQHLQTNRRSHH
jgi:hypothetical protein